MGANGVTVVLATAHSCSGHATLGDGLVAFAMALVGAVIAWKAL